MTSPHDIRLLLVDHETAAILCSVPTPAVGNFLLLGMHNTYLGSVAMAPLMPGHVTLPEFDTGPMQKMINTWSYEELTFDKITPALMSRRSMATMKKITLHQWEQSCNASQIRSRGYMSPSAEMYIRHELTRTSSSNFIREYAELNQLAFDAAAQDLRLKMESIGVQEARNWAVFDMIAHKIALAPTVPLMYSEYNAGFDLLHTNSVI